MPRTKGVRTITLHTNQSSFISHFAAIEMNLRPGDKISLGQDLSDPRLWYLYLDPKNGFECVKYKAGSSTCRALRFKPKQAPHIACGLFDIPLKKVTGVFIEPDMNEIDGVATMFYRFILRKPTQ